VSCDEAEDSAINYRMPRKKLCMICGKAPARPVTKMCAKCPKVLEKLVEETTFCTLSTKEKYDAVFRSDVTDYLIEEAVRSCLRNYARAKRK
jgi:glutamine synthetase adenylyltransferase